MSILEWFVAELCCPVCGQVSEADTETNMVTRVRGDTIGIIAVGDPIGVAPEQVASGGYLPVNPYQPGEPLRLLELWECPFCGTSDNWAEVVVRDGIVESIRAVPLDNATLDRAHFISWRLTTIYPQITGQPLFVDGQPRPDAFTLLRARLP